MKVGVLLSDQSPLIGGGYTFEEGILASLLRLRDRTTHELVLVGAAAEKPDFARDFGWASLQPAPPTGGKPDWLLDFEAAPHLAAAGLDLIVYLNPFVSPFLDLPFIINVWDFAHRLLPAFPEVTLAGEWQQREELYREKLQRAAYIIASNDRGRQEIVGLYQTPAEKIRLLHLPTPDYALQAGEGTSLRHLGVGDDDFLFYPAQFWPHKNHILLLRLLKILGEKEGYRPKLVLTGADKPVFNNGKQGNLAFVQQRVGELGLQDQVIFAGFVSRQDMISLYRRATALVYPSFFGPENIPPLEAFALDCPVVTGAIPGSEEQYGDAALRVDPTRPELWAEAVQQIRQDPSLRKSLMAKGRSRARQFTSDEFTLGLFKIIDEFEAYRCNWSSSLVSRPPRS